MSETKLLEYLPEFIEAFTAQLEADQERWGDTWLNRTKEGQEDRIMNDYMDYYDQFRFSDKPFPWLKVIGNAYIAWVREKHPELFSK